MKSDVKQLFERRIKEKKNPSVGEFRRRVDSDIYNQCLLLMDQKNYEEVINLLADANFVLEDVDAQCMLGKAHFFCGNKDKAFECWSRADNGFSKSASAMKTNLAAIALNGRRRDDDVYLLGNRLKVLAT